MTLASTCTCTTKETEKRSSCLYQERKVTCFGCFKDQNEFLTWIGCVGKCDL